MPRKFEQTNPEESDQDDQLHERTLVGDKSEKKPDSEYTYEELYDLALAGNEEALSKWASLYLYHRQAVNVDLIGGDLDKIIYSNSDPRRWNAKFMRSRLYLENNSSKPIDPKMNELLDEIINCKNTEIPYLKSKALYYRAENYNHGNGCEQNPKLALKYFRLAIQTGNDSAKLILNHTGKTIGNKILEEDNQKIENALINFEKSIDIIYKTAEPSIKLKEKEKTKLLKEVAEFLTEAKEICRTNTERVRDADNKNPLLAEDYLEDTCKQLFDLAAQKFTHRHKIRRILADILFIPLGFATLGAALIAKKLITGAFTFYGEKTRRENLLNQELSPLQIPTKS